ncbi:MAG: hypothetical protein H7Y31_01500, partial [Chitinophagaceae bacterium]|nr:hypothetical protein [Chitinophagaceae bacterium]
LLYIATYAHGLVYYDIQTKKLQELTGYKTREYAFYLDGLGLFDNKLYGVYNGDSTNQKNGTIYYTLSQDGRSITDEYVLQQGHQSMKEPTTLAIGNGVLYLLANSHLAIYNANKESLNGVSTGLQPVTILAYDLKR